MSVLLPTARDNPGKLTQVDTFRIGTIGRLFPSDVEQLVQAIGKTLHELASSKAADRPIETAAAWNPK